MPKRTEAVRQLLADSAPEPIDGLALIRNSPALYGIWEALRLRGEANQRVRDEHAAKEARKAKRLAKRAGNTEQAAR